jgi:hypothetical protein
LTLDPVEIAFEGGLTVRLQTVVTFPEGSGEIRYERRILSMSDPNETVTIREYITASYGTTEYPEDMTSLTLRVEAGEESTVIPYHYECREASAANAESVSCTLPPIRTRVTMRADGERVGFVREGYAFSPMFSLGYERECAEKEVFTTWLRLERAD